MIKATGRGAIALDIETGNLRWHTMDGAENIDGDR